MVGNQRGGARDLALHLLKDENERVEVHELRGFASDDLLSALRESQGISRATRCRQHLYSLSLNPPKDAQLTDADFIAAIDRAEQTLNLSGQSRAIVFHEKRGEDGLLRRHAHAVWCRIDPHKMKAIHMSSDRRRLQSLSRDLFLEHGWDLPRGHLNPLHRDSRNFKLEEWQQAKRARKDPRALKSMFQACWAQSDGRQSFAHALRERGYILAKGDRRGFVAVDHKGEVYPVSRWAGVKAKEVGVRLGDLESLPTVKEAHEEATKAITRRLKELQAEQHSQTKENLRQLASQREAGLEHSRQERASLAQRQAARAAKEEAARQARLRKGLVGLLDRLTGRRRRTLERNRISAARAQLRDKLERRELNHKQERTHRSFKEQAEAERTRHNAVRLELSTDIKAIEAPLSDDKARRREEFKAKRKAESQARAGRRARDGPKIER